METQALNCKESDDVYVFENDTIRVEYSFWAYRGQMAFKIFNKTNKPIFVNWKNSSFILNGYKLDVWNESENITTATSGMNAYGLWNSKYPVSIGYSTSVSNSVKPEKVTFIPPKSGMEKITFLLIPDLPHTFSKKAVRSKVILSDCKSRKTWIKTDTFSLDNSPLTFRNYLAISASEDSEDFWYIDNGFYLSKVKEMTYRHFLGKTINIKGKHTNSKAEKKPTSFYIYVNQETP